MASGRQIAEENVRKLQAWAVGINSPDGWAAFVSNGRLNRSAIAGACGFGRSVFVQNPAAKTFAAELETRLVKEGVLQPKSTSTPPVREASYPDGRALSASDAKVRSLERDITKRDERIAVLLAEITALRNRLRCLDHVEQIMETGRRIPP